MNIRITPNPDDMSIEDSERWNAEQERREANEGAGYSPPGARKKRKRNSKDVNSIRLPNDTWRALVDRANVKGDKLADFIANLCTQLVIGNLLDKLTETDSFQIDALQTRTRRYFERLDELESAVLEYSARPTPDMASMLARQCDYLGVNLDDIVKRVKGDPIMEVASDFKSDPSTKTNQCVRWMVALMREHKFKLMARDGNALGAAEGFTKDMMKTARDRLGVQSIPVDGEYH